MKLPKLPENSGVYFFKDKSGKKIYIGKTINLKNRVKSYFAKNILSEKTRQMVEQTASLDFIKTQSEFEALLLEAKLIRKYQPKYNISLKDDKHPLYIKITAEEFPKILTVRQEDDKKSTYFGPFPSSTIIRDTLRFLRRIFPFCTEKRLGKKPCFYSHIRLCNPCPNFISRQSPSEEKKLKAEYCRNIQSVKNILNGKSKTLIKRLEQQMQKRAKNLEFEKAAEIRKKIEKLNYLTKPRFSVSEYLKNPNLYEDLRQKELDNLAKLLNIGFPHRIEGYDISNIMGKSATGSMVVFINGEADKSKYRRFKIKTKKGIDDYAMLREVFLRRIKHEDWDFPDLVLIDGGEGQVNAVYQVLVKNNLNIPIAGLAKKNEEIVIPDADGIKVIRLKIGSPALSVSQRVRDEAHRFAKKYHLYLRSKNMIKT